MLWTQQSHLASALDRSTCSPLESEGPSTPTKGVNGSGGFMIVRHPNSTAKVFNFRETAPAGATKGMYDGDPLASLFGGLAVGVPGEIAGYAEASEMFGNLPWKRLFKESI